MSLPRSPSSSLVSDLLHRGNSSKEGHEVKQSIPIKYRNINIVVEKADTTIKKISYNYQIFNLGNLNQTFHLRV